MQVVVLLAVCIGGFVFMAALFRSDLIGQYQQRALAIARTVAEDGRNAAAVTTGDAAGDVQRRVEPIRRRTGALFIVVTDSRGVRYSHPDPSLLHKPVDPGQEQALRGREVVTFSSSAAGTSARGKVPMIGANGTVVGQVIVAMDAKQINGRLFSLLRWAAVLAGLALGVGTVAALAMTRRLKRQTFGLEPASLALLLEQQAALHRVATLVARGVAPTEVFDAVVAEVRQLLDAGSTSLLRFESDGTVTVVAAGGDAGAPVHVVGTRVSFEPGTVPEVVHRTGRPARVGGSPPEPACTVGAPVVVEASWWGVIVASWMDEAAVSVDAEVRIGEFTDLVATAIANAESRAQLTASRARVVAAADDARRLIERDLHDGTQQRLVSLALELRSVEAMVPPEADHLRGRLSDTAGGLAEAVENLQEIARGIHPAILSKGGLAPALNALVRRSPVRVELEVDAGERLPTPVEVAAYYVVSEALTNAAKHARATLLRVTVQNDGASLRLSVRDDGVGGADAGRGSGLIGLRDRVETVGGRMEITSPAGRGTSLLITIPLP
jgi:signal transduction histidine kinase